MNEFIAIDVETANESLSSICQIGLVKFSNGEVVETWSSLINPKQPFSGFNISIHGITHKHVKGCPTIKDIYHLLQSWLENKIVVHHTHFDRSAIAQSCERYNLPQLNFISVDSARAVRRTWIKYTRYGYGLNNVARDLKIEFKHHDALEDARAAGLIMNAAIRESGVEIQDWPERISINRPTLYEVTLKQVCDAAPNPNGHLYGEVIVFTGSLQIPRLEAAEMAYKAGCDVDANVTKNTTLLVVGIQDIYKMTASETKSSKHRKAEKLILAGQQIKIITEEDFKFLVKYF